jgi:hypothetical protein
MSFAVIERLRLPDRFGIILDRGGRGRTSAHFRFAPKGTVGRQNAVRRKVPSSDWDLLVPAGVIWPSPIQREICVHVDVIRAVSDPSGSLLGTSSRHNRGSAFLIVAVNLHVFPHVVYVIGIAPYEPIDGSAVVGIDDEYAAAGRLTIVRNKATSSDHIHVVFFSRIKMDAVIAIEFRTHLRFDFLVGSMNYKQHGGTPEREIMDNASLVAPAKRRRAHVRLSLGSDQMVDVT